MSESYVLCEGYHDRAFWAGFLLHLGCTDPGTRPGGRRGRIFDPFGDPVASGNYAFHSRSGSFVRIVPAGGITEIPAIVRNRLRESIVKPLVRLVINVDTDLNADGSPTTGFRLSINTLTTIVRNFDPAMVVDPDGDMAISGGTARVSLVSWQAPDPPTGGLPNQNTLERLICSAMIAAYPNRGPSVQNWLDSRPEAPPAGPKEYAWSYLAGWHADTGGYEGFCTSLWHDPLIVAQLRPRMQACGIWRIGELLAA